MELHQLQAEVTAWSQRNFPNNKPYHPLLGAMEELGELTHAHLKLEQGIRGSESELKAAKIDAIGDIIIYLADYCGRNGINLQAAVESTWFLVSKRDWQKNPTTGK